MPASQTCPQCHGPLPAHADAWLCPRCLLGQAASRAESSPPAATTLPPAPVAEQTGDRLGRYKLLQQLGQGGMGTVWMAEQIEPVRRRVALKILKAGMDTREVVLRFEAERQALALMDHPNIARVFDAGATSTGRPYFVMELVPGIRLTDYCDQNRLSVRERLDLFIQVCHAVQHAHQKGIIHRDLKPSNILVTLHDGVPVPKVIDFGIAKATAQPLTEQTLFTQLGAVLGTPAYMSPEQTELSGLDIDTRSDIYSLGVLLYQLLTGRPPFEPKELMAGGIEQMCRIIRESEPPRPSTRLTTLGREDLATLARRHGTEAPRLVHLVRGDLDWIVMKCLEKDRRRRYETANGLAADLERHLQHEPVLARPPSAAYRLQTLVRRHRLAFAAATSILVALLAGLGLALWQYAEKSGALVRAVAAEKEQGRLRESAQTEAARSRQVAQFLKDLLQGVGPAKARGRDTAMLREILDQTSQRIGLELTNQPDIALELHSILSSAYTGIGQYPEAVRMSRERLRLSRELHGPESLPTANALAATGDTLRRQAEYAEADDLLAQALALQRKWLGQQDPAVAKTLYDMAQSRRDQGRLGEAESLLREALAIQRAGTPRDVRSIADTLDTLGSVVRERGQLPEAESLLREALDLHRRWSGADSLQMAGTMQSLASVLQGAGRADEAEPLVREALAVQRKVFEPGHPQLANTINTMAVVLGSLRQYADAELLAREAVDMLRRRPSGDPLNLANALNTLAMAQRGGGRIEEAEGSIRESIVIQRRLFPGGHPDLANALNSLAALLGAQKRYAEAESAVREALDMQRKLFGREHPETANSVNTLAALLLRQRKFAEAETAQREALLLRLILPGGSFSPVAQAILNLQAILQAQARTNDFDVLFAEAIPQARALLKDQPARWEGRLALLADGLARQGRHSIAAPLFEEATVSARQRLGPDHDQTAVFAASQARFLYDWAWLDLPTNNPARTRPDSTLTRALDAERLLSDVLRHRSQHTNASPARTAELQGRLGFARGLAAIADPSLDSATRAARLAAADALLQEAHAALTQSRGSEQRYLRDNLDRLQRLHGAWETVAPQTGHAAKAAEYQRKLAEFDAPPPRQP